MPRKGLIQIIQLLSTAAFLRRHQLAGDATQLAAYVHKVPVLITHPSSINTIFESRSLDTRITQLLEGAAHL